MLRAANLAGKAINITTTTAPHALSYKLTSSRRLPHGHAVALCMGPCWKILIDAVQNESHLDSRISYDDLEKRLSGISRYLCEAPNAGPISGFECFQALIDELGIDRHLNLDSNEIIQCVDMVNIQRLKNFPIVIDRDTVMRVYTEL